MTNLARALIAAAIGAVAAPAFGQVLLLSVENVNVPMASTLDNPCTAAAEAIAFAGTTNITQRVWLESDGRLRLQFYETTTLQGVDTLSSPLAPVSYAVASMGEQDVVFEPIALEVLQFKKVVRAGGADNFHSVLVIGIDPLNLRLNIKLEAACDDGAA